MKKTSIYVDTSVIGGCCDSEFQEWSRGLLLDFQSRKFSLLLSELTDAEIQDAPDEVKNTYIEFRECTDSIFLISPEAIELADAYLNHNILFFQAEDGIRDLIVTGVQTCALPIYAAQRADGALLLFAFAFSFSFSSS